MNKGEIALKHRYNNRAGARILNIAAGVSRWQCLASSTYPHGGLCGALTYILSAAWIGRRRWQREQRAFMDFVENFIEPVINNVFRYKNTKGTAYKNVLRQVMIHAVNHGAQHRGGTAAMLTDMDRSAGGMNPVIFMRRQDTYGQVV